MCCAFERMTSESSFLRRDWREFGNKGKIAGREKMMILQSKELFSILLEATARAEGDTDIIDEIVPFSPERTLAKDQKEPDTNQTDESFRGDHQAERRHVAADRC